MKHRIGIRIVLVLASMVMIGGIFIQNAWASGESSLFTRENWDLALRWINFIILAGVIVKYGRKPLLQFLDGQKKSITGSIDELESRKKEAEARVLESERQLDDSKNRLAQIEERIITEGQQHKEQLIADAQSEAKSMMASAQGKIEGQMKSAYAQIRTELVDMAADLALTKLPEVITDTEQNQWIDHWFASSGK